MQPTDILMQGSSIRFTLAAGRSEYRIIQKHDYDGKDGPPGHPDLKGFGANRRIFFWLRIGTVEGRATHVGFVANSQAEVDAAYAAAIAAGNAVGPPAASKI